MSKPVGNKIFSFALTQPIGPAYHRCSARELGMAESWMSDAILACPDLVIAPCLAAGVCDEEEWFGWQREFSSPVGPVDVLLVSASGRIAVVETKLAHNAELRRRVLAQVLDYVTHLPDALREHMPPLPTDASGRSVAERDEILDRVEDGDMLIVIASDDLDPRAERLSKGLLGSNLAKHWDLALVDLALYRLGDNTSAGFIVPTVVGATVTDTRQVVRVIVEGATPKARISVEPVSAEESTSGNQRWNEERFFERLEAEVGSSPVLELALGLRNLVREVPSLAIAWGRGKKDGSMTVKRRDAGLIEVYSNGWLGFRPNKFARALGESAGENYLRALARIAPRALGMDYPMLPPVEAQAVAGRVLPALRDVVRLADEAEAAALTRTGPQ